MKDTAETAETASFGYETVALDEKQGRVDRVFHRVASRYDVMNDLMSVGVHRLWKQAMVHWLNPPRLGRPYRVLDMAGGTGDIAFRIRDHSRGHAQVTVCDINESMLAVGRTRAERRRIEGLSFVLANAEDLFFEDRSFDAYTIAFGIRNVARRERALREAFRVLKRGGRFLCLEFSHVAVPGLDRLYDAYSMNAIPVIGKVVAGHEDAYRYLVESIRTFPDQERFAAMIGDAGFERVTWRNLSGGIAAIHSGWKI